MSRPGQTRVYAQLPARFDDKTVATSTIDAHGRLVALLVDPDVTCNQRVPPDERRPYDALAVTISDTHVNEVVIKDLDLHFPKIDTLADGFVIVAARCTMPSGPTATTHAELDAEIPRNARIIGSNGETRVSFHAGDGIEHLITDRNGTIWTGYFDEASICAQPTSRMRRARHDGYPGHRITMSMPGLIRWTPDGEPDWYAVNDGVGPRSWVDCYALNVGIELTWAYPYTGFPLVEIDEHGTRCTRRTPVRSASGIVIAGQVIAFIASHGPHPQVPGAYLVTTCHVTNGLIEATNTIPLLMPDGTEPDSWMHHKVCRDGRMWMTFADDRTWYVMEIE